MAQIRFNRLVCDNPQEDSWRPGPGMDGDEVYLAVGGRADERTQVFDNMDAGDVRLLTNTFGFAGAVDVRLFESDSGTNPDDHLGTAHITANQVGNHDAVFETAGVRYVLNYDVIA